MKLHFGLSFDFPVYPEPPGGVWSLGPKGLLHLLESHCGLSGHPNNNEHLRIEQYRQTLLRHAVAAPGVFYRAALEADQLAAASTLLEMRDELTLAGWDFAASANTPKRLQTLCKLEQLLRSDKQTLHLPPGFADRFVALLDHIDHHDLPFSEIQCNEPGHLLPAHVNVLFDKFEKRGVVIHNFTPLEPVGDSDLTQFKKLLLRQSDFHQKKKLKNDGSLLILRAKRDTVAAAFLAQLLRLNPGTKPLCLIPEKNRILDNAFIQEGLPSLGILSDSLARPSLQILKLVSAFLWEPIDPYKILEFVSLAIKPLANDLAAIIAGQMAQAPGMGGPNWVGLIEGYFDQLKERAKTDKSIKVKAIRKEYEFWFRRPRYHISKSVPKPEVIALFEHLQQWAYAKYEETAHKNNNLLVLSGQARRIVDLLEALPAQDRSLTYLELERIVRTIYEPTPVLFKEKETGHFPFVHHTSGITEGVNTLLWWNFSRNEYEHFFSRWYPDEVAYLSEKGVRLTGPEEKNQLLLWQRPRPVYYCREQLLLVIPEMVNGTEVYTHPLYEEMEAGLEGLAEITYHLDTQKGRPHFEKHFSLPGYSELPYRQLGQPLPFLQVDRPGGLAPREEETLTSLESLFYYPYQWVFRYKLRLRKSSILSVVADNTLKGNLAHRFFEQLLREDIADWSSQQIYEWIDQKAQQLLRREGAVLLLYGREPERFDFIRKVKFAAHSLVAAIQQNNWTVLATEEDLTGRFVELPVKGKADLILSRKEERLIIDLKWRGATRRENMFKNEEDLQLVMYAQLIGPTKAPVHTAYFILENGRLIARNNQALKEATAVVPLDDHADIQQQIYERMERTYRWRRTQLEEGRIEVRTPHTLPDLELAYEGELMHLLEMKSQEAFFDDYRVLINLVE